MNQPAINLQLLSFETVSASASLYAYYTLVAFRSSSYHRRLFPMRRQHCQPRSKVLLAGYARFQSTRTKHYPTVFCPKQRPRQKKTEAATRNRRPDEEDRQGIWETSAFNQPRREGDERESAGSSCVL